MDGDINLAKRFNITGTCIPKKNYMVNTSHKLNEILKLIDNEEYFIINKPRQYGKTTTMFLLEKELDKREDYLVIRTSFEGVGDIMFDNEEVFSKEFTDLIADIVENKNEEYAQILKESITQVSNLKTLSKVITKFIRKVDKNVVLMIDEVDKSSNNQVFMSFLGMLRNKYLLRNEGIDNTFSSVILAGVHDVKSLKFKMRAEYEQKYNSPWNIAADFKVDMSFSKEEIKTMLNEYCTDKNINMDKEFFSERLRYYTSGYPFLVSKLCKIIDEDIMQESDSEWKNEYMDTAVKMILKDNNTNFDSLIKNIENDEKLKNMVKELIIDGNNIIFNINNPIINSGIMYGIFKEEDHSLKINNKIYELLLYDYMSSLIETSTGIGLYNNRSRYIDKNGDIDVKKMLIGFADFMKHERNNKHENFLEIDGRLLFLAFISPIINGTGFAFKEVQGGDEKRFDIVITYNRKMYILELKIWKGESYHQNGIIQLGQYLDQYNLDEGYLLIFDFRKEKSLRGTSKEENIRIGQCSKNIFEIYV